MSFTAAVSLGNTPPAASRFARLVLLYNTILSTQCRFGVTLISMVSNVILLSGELGLITREQ